MKKLLVQVAIVATIALAVSCNKNKAVSSDIKSDKVQYQLINANIPFSLSNIGQIHNAICNDVVYEMLSEPYFLNSFDFKMPDSTVKLSTQGKQLLIDRLATHFAAYYQSQGINRTYSQIKAHLEDCSNTTHTDNDFPHAFIPFKAALNTIAEESESALATKKEMNDYYDENIDQVRGSDAQFYATLYKNVFVDSRIYWNDNTLPITDSLHGSMKLMRGKNPNWAYWVFMGPWIIDYLESRIGRIDAFGAVGGAATAAAHGIADPTALALAALEGAALASGGAYLSGS